MRKESDLYKKVVYWSNEDNCFIGMCPELMYGGIHGDDALKVFVELNEAVEEVIELFKEDGKPLPEPRALAVVGELA
jgi:predicted RNase H-like HicB family nuclease